MVLQAWMMLCLTMGLALALAPVPRQTMEESLRSALDAISRKQRSLDDNSQDYYNDFRGFKYHGDDGERKFDRERQAERELDDEDEEIEFLPSEVGQLETVGNGYQDLNNKLLKRALIAYLKSIPQQDEPVTSLFRERERSSNRKRDSEPERLNLDNKELAKLYMLLKELQNDSPYSIEDGEEERYLDPHQIIYDPYRGDRGNKLAESSGPMSWGELMARGQSRDTDENDYGDREQDPNFLYIPMGDPRTVNGGYSVGRSQRTYRSMAKRYPIAKRSPKPMPTKKQVTDPKVAQDLGALFGTQTTNTQNRTHSHDHDHNHNYDHDHDHDHDHSHDHSHNHDQDHNHDHEHGDQHKPESSSEPPNSVTSSSKGQKENTGKSIKSKPIEVKKKSDIDWSLYFGIDRRRKKATFTAGQGSQKQDDDWMLQRYYENTVENLKDQDFENDWKERLDQLDPGAKNVKDLILEENLKYADTEDGMNSQKIKDSVMARLAAAYSYEKMWKILNELRNRVALKLEAQKAAHGQSNQTSNFRENNPKNLKDKRVNGNNLQLVENEKAEENRVCPELEIIEKSCRRTVKIAGDVSELLYVPCVMLQICKACVQDELQQECLINYAVEAGKICNAQELREGAKGREGCVSTAMIISQLQVPPMISEQCRIDDDSCLRHRLYPY